MSAGSGASLGPAESLGTASAAARLNIGGTRLADRGVVVNYPAAGGPKLPAVPASAYVIADANTGQVLAAKDPHGQFAPASTLKVLTAITMLPRLNPNAMVTVSKLAASQEPNIAGLIAGHQYQVSALFKALLLISANDAAVALTETAGSFATGMQLINAEAQHLQAYDVVAKMPNGLPAPGQVVSAYDEALIARQALASPAFMSYDSTLSAPFQIKPGKSETLLNQNSLLTHYKGGIGGKIGWTQASGATYIGMARRDGVTLIVTVLHCTALQEITAGEKLLNWGFAEDGQVTPVGTLVSPLPTAAALHRAAVARARAAARVKAAQLSSQAEARSSKADAGLAVGGGIAVVTAIGLTTLARARRRAARTVFPDRHPGP
ncbi:MAG TPA: D-alanyl-D-alanine carboxypeptidase [Streptosporangiaceae bacterium]|nr:D-alanyl-D-alanine carboxypeptidase [Streptosporangiaceae bacterium]